MRFCAQNLTLRTISQLEGQVVMAFGCGGGSARKSDRSAALIETRRTNSCRSCGQMIMRSRYKKKKTIGIGARILDLRDLERNLRPVLFDVCRSSCYNCARFGPSTLRQTLSISFSKAWDLSYAMLIAILDVASSERFFRCDTVWLVSSLFELAA